MLSLCCYHQKARKSRQNGFRDKTAYVWALDYRWRSFAIDDHRSRGRATYAGLLAGIFVAIQIQSGLLCPDYIVLHSVIKKCHCMENYSVTWAGALAAHELTESSLQRLLRKLLLTKQYMKKLRELKEGSKWTTTIRWNRKTDCLVIKGIVHNFFIFRQNSYFE